MKFDSRMISGLSNAIANRLKTHAKAMNWDELDMPADLEVQAWIVEWVCQQIDVNAHNMKNSIKDIESDIISEYAK